MNAVPFYGLVVACFDDPVVSRLAKTIKRRVVSFGLSPENDFSAADVVVHQRGSDFTLRINGQDVQRVTLPLLGTHMVSNSLAAIAVAVELGATPAEACEALKTFPGVARRSEMLGEEKGVVVVDDYAHHPREISATLAAIRRGWIVNRAAEGHELGRLVVIFQPHRFSRTKELFSDFLTCFQDADRLVMGEIYAAGEREIPGISGAALAAAVQHQYVSFVPDLSESVADVVSALRPGDVVVTVGAGSVGQLGSKILELLRQTELAANG